MDIVYIGAIITILVVGSLIWFSKQNPKINKKIKKLLEKFECCV